MAGDDPHGSETGSGTDAPALDRPARDTLFATDAAPGPAAFDFGPAVVRVFDDMVSRSVPLYDVLQRLAATLVLRLKAPGAIYDLGCSTGATLLALIEQAVEPLTLVGFDKSPDMIEACRRKLAPRLGAHRLTLHRVDLEGASPPPIEDCGAIVLSLVAQFLQPASRRQLLRTLGARLEPGGCLVLVEKTVQASPAIDAAFVETYHDFKAAQGYSRLEIARKREALENRLVPFRADENVAMLRDAGFAEVEIFFAWLNFQGYLAIKR
jgi:tRNA (cmo5U34)-methyltransferase